MLTKIDEAQSVRPSVFGMAEGGFLYKYEVS